MCEILIVKLKTVKTTSYKLAAVGACIMPQETGYNILMGTIEYSDNRLKNKLRTKFLFEEYYVKEE